MNVVDHQEDMIRQENKREVENEAGPYADDPGPRNEAIQTYVPT